MEKYDKLPGFQQGLEEIAREGARKMLHQAIESEVEEFIKQYNNSKDENGHMIVKRNGYLPEREIQTGLGPIKVKKPRVKGEQFTSAILPKYMRRAPSMCRIRCRSCTCCTAIRLLLRVHERRARTLRS